VFPSLVIRSSSLEARGSFAEAQATFLSPDPDEVRALDALLQGTNAGIVAHFYMDAEIQGALSQVKHPFVHVADSLQMAERAVDMASRGAKAIVVLGVDFMSENVRATLDAAGFASVPVLRVAEKHIGCSLAEAAETASYEAYLRKASQTPHSLHVIYVNTSLRTKALAESLLPTITCTSSNVVQTVLEARAAMPEAHVWFGPDTYMGHNLEALFRVHAASTNEQVRALHPGHSLESLRSLLPCFHTFEEGVCIVHHMFGDRVVERLERDYGDALLAAHFEVPGGMFRLALAAQARGRGVVGSTSNILAFIEGAAASAAKRGDGHERVVLGTESGMVASIVRSAQRALAGSGASVEIVFPVAEEAITASGDALLPVIPGPADGEGCSTEGGCATCPFMKMNSLGALDDVLSRLRDHGEAGVESFRVRPTADALGTQSIAELGTRSIVRMREFQKTGRMPSEFVRAVMGA
jgi:quinolinate synthase